MKYLFFSDWLELVFFVCQENGLDFGNYFLGNTQIKKLEIGAWNELKSVIKSDDIFQEMSGGAGEIFLIDILDLPLQNPKEILAETGKNVIYFYSSTSSKTLTNLKTLGKKEKIEIIDTQKIEEKKLVEFVNNFSQKNNLKLTNRQVFEIVRGSGGKLSKIKNILDLLQIVPDRLEEILKTQIVEQKEPTFMKRFDLKNFKNTLDLWQNEVADGSNDLQLVLALVAGKVSKSGAQNQEIKKVLKLIAKTDYDFKMGKFEERGAWLSFLNQVGRILD